MNKKALVLAFDILLGLALTPIAVQAKNHYIVPDIAVKHVKSQKIAFVSDKNWNARSLHWKMIQQEQARARRFHQ